MLKRNLKLKIWISFLIKCSWRVVWPPGRHLCWCRLMLTHRSVSFRAHSPNCRFLFGLLWFPLQIASERSIVGNRHNRHCSKHCFSVEYLLNGNDTIRIFSEFLDLCVKVYHANSLGLLVVAFSGILHQVVSTNPRSKDSYRQNHTCRRPLYRHAELFVFSPWNRMKEHTSLLCGKNGFQNLKSNGETYRYQKPSCNWPA